MGERSASGQRQPDSEANKHDAGYPVHRAVHGFALQPAAGEVHGGDQQRKPGEPRASFARAW
jgi:hypothetical protein